MDDSSLSVLVSWKFYSNGCICYGLHTTDAAPDQTTSSVSVQLRCRLSNRLWSLVFSLRGFVQFELLDSMHRVIGTGKFNYTRNIPPD